jgi:hypothetical protein
MLRMVAKSPVDRWFLHPIIYRVSMSFNHPFGGGFRNHHFSHTYSPAMNQSIKVVLVWLLVSTPLKKMLVSLDYYPQYMEK